MKSRKRRVRSQHLPESCPETVMEGKLRESGCDKGAEFCFCCYTEAYGFHPQENLLLCHTNARMKEKGFATECCSSLGTCHKVFRFHSSTELKEIVRFLAVLFRQQIPNSLFYAYCLGHCPNATLPLVLPLAPEMFWGHPKNLELNWAVSCACCWWQAACFGWPSMRKFLLCIDVSCEVGTLVTMAWCKCPFSVLQKEKREAVSLGCTLERTPNDLVALGGTVLREEVQRISSRLVIR